MAAALGLRRIHRKPAQEGLVLQAHTTDDGNDEGRTGVRSLEAIRPMLVIILLLLAVGDAQVGLLALGMYHGHDAYPYPWPWPTTQTDLTGQYLHQHNFVFPSKCPAINDRRPSQPIILASTPPITLHRLGIA